MNADDEENYETRMTENFDKFDENDLIPEEIDELEIE
jgi:hypothetical protein